MHKTLVFPLQNQAVHIANSFHVNLHLQPDNKLQLSSNQAWLNLEDFFPTGEPFLLSCSKHDFVLSVFPFFIFISGILFFSPIIIIMNKLVLNKFQQLELIFLLLTLHLGLSQSGRLSISINITESSGICINVLLTSWQSFGKRSWDLRSKGKKDCIIPYTGWIVRSCQVKPQVSFSTTKIWDKISTHKQVHISDNFAVLTASLLVPGRAHFQLGNKMFYCYLMDVELAQGVEVLSKIFYKAFKGSQEMYILVTGAWTLWKVIQTLLNKLVRVPNKRESCKLLITVG